MKALSVAEAAPIVGRSPSTLYARIARGEVPLDLSALPRVRVKTWWVHQQTAEVKDSI